MITEEQLDSLRVSGTKVCVKRDSDPANDVKGVVVAWDDEFVLLRKQNRKIVKLDRTYHIEPLNMTERGTV